MGHDLIESTKPEGLGGRLVFRVRPERFYTGLCQQLLSPLVQGGVNDGEWRGRVTSEDDDL